MKFLAALLVAAIAGAAVAWGMVNREYVQRPSYFGVIDRARDVTAETVMSKINLGVDAKYAQMSLPDGTLFDFGVMAPGDKGEHLFVVRNTGDMPLSLGIGASTCKCTVGSLKHDTLQPGAETTVKMAWTVNTTQDDFEQFAELKSNDPQRPVVQIKVRGRVVRGIEIVPKAWSFGEVAAGDPIEFNAKVYNYLDHDIEPTKLGFGTGTLRNLSEIKLQPFSPTEENDGVHGVARQGFQINLTVRPGLPQGSIQREFQFGYQHLGDGDSAAAVTANDEAETPVVNATFGGRIVGSLSMITTSQLEEPTTGVYLFNLGRLDPDGDLEAKAFVVLKGSEREQTELSIGAASPEGIVEASLEEPMVRETMSLQRLHVNFHPGPEAIELLGKGSGDLGWVQIDSNNPKVPSMRILLKFALPAQ